MFRNRLIVLHPFLFTLFPILSLYANNISQEPFGAVARSIGIALAVVGMLLWLLRLVLKDWQRAGLVVTVAALLVFGFGRISRLFTSPAGASPGWMVAIWLVILLAVEILIAYRLRRMPRKVTRMLNIVGALALATCLYGFASYGVHISQVGRVERVRAAAPQASVPPAAAQIATVQSPSFQTPEQPRIVPLSEQPPDIYYIILDGHARSDVLNEIYGVDNGPFIRFLQKRGFIVASDSHSNYAQTALSLSSSLNFRYLDKMITLDPASADRSSLTGLINNSDAQRFLRAQGYTTVAFNNGFSETEMASADEFIRDPAMLNDFELSLLTQSLGGAELSPQMIENYRQHILWQRDELEKQAELPGPKFVFAHFILPHPPFVFRVDSSAPITFNSGDGSQFAGTREEYYQGYREQVQFADALAAQMIAYILDHSAREPVIILQGDHGSGLYLDWNSQSDTCLRERFSILNAYYLPHRYNLPGKNAAWSISPGISPVNSFRVVFDAYFDANLPLLPDRSYFSLWASPYELNDVTGELEKSCK